MVCGIVGKYTKRKPDPDKIRGFALVDNVAPLIFINVADTKAAQMFTLTHRLVHLWLSESALSDSRPDSLYASEIEVWCNRVVAEILAQINALREEFCENEDIDIALSRLARRFKVSKLVILRQVHDLAERSSYAYRSTNQVELDRLLELPKTSGGNFYPALRVRVGHRFGYALVSSTLEGRTSSSESFRLLGVKKMATFKKVAESLRKGY